LEPPKIVSNLTTEGSGHTGFPGSSGLAHGSLVQAPPIVDPPVVSAGTRIADVDPWRIGLPRVMARWFSPSPATSFSSGPSSLFHWSHLSRSLDLSLILNLFVFLEQKNEEEEMKNKKEE
jgi:hypothetical protein